MDPLAKARELASAGRFADALESFDQVPQVRLGPHPTLERASLLEVVGRTSEAAQITAQVLRSKTTEGPTRALGEYILSRIAADHGSQERELNHLHKALAIAEKCGETRQAAWCQLRLIALTSELTGPISCDSLVRAARHTVSCAGDPHLIAALHLFVADVDGKHGSVDKSERHVRLALGLLKRWENVWLESWAENTLLALHLVRSDYAGAEQHGAMALDLAKVSGARTALRSALANLGQLNFALGRNESALLHLESALHYTDAGSEHYVGVIDTLARVRLATGDFEESYRLAEQALRSSGNSEPTSYVRRNSLLTRGEILIRLGRHSEALSCFTQAASIGARVGDLVLEGTANLLAREAEAVLFGPPGPDARSTWPQPLTPIGTANYERSLAVQLLSTGASGAAMIHRDRASRILRAIGDVPRELDIRRTLGELEANPQEGVSSNHTLVQDTATTLMHAGRPELVAAGLLAIARQLPCITAAAAVSVAGDGDIEVLDSFGALDAAPATRSFRIGVARQRSVELRIGLLADLESHATVNSIGFMLAAIHELERGRMEREERLTLWPVDELPAEDDDSVVTGKMRDIMIFARRIAPNPVTVLVTGESGTGKEVLARAIHRYSPRAAKPFIPFNCTAVPRELLESQLFGHKRGAFTGADRDNPGLIRAARDGTLFLDEIGELSLELQPKLLRFLESNEISPLGDPTPVRVDVRVIAATNAKLEQLVAAGRFREDLFYRLNVIEIALPPLRERRDEIQPLAHSLTAKAAFEFGKGRVTVGDELMAHLLVYPWPGNVRQLNNELRRMVAIVDPDTRLTPDHLPRTLRSEIEEIMRRENGLEISIRWTEGLDQTVARIEREMIRAALARCHGRVEAAAKALGISRKGLYLKRRRLGV